MGQRLAVDGERVLRVALAFLILKPGRQAAVGEPVEERGRRHRFAEDAVQRKRNGAVFDRESNRFFGEESGLANT